MDICVT